MCYADLGNKELIRFPFKIFEQTKQLRFHSHDTLALILSHVNQTQKTPVEVNSLSEFKFRKFEQVQTRTDFNKSKIGNDEAKVMNTDLV